MPTKISQLPDVPSVDGAEQVPIAKSGSSFKMAVSRLMVLIRGSVVRGPDSESMQPLPSAVSRAGKILMFDGVTGEPVAGSEIDGGTF